MSDSLRPRGLQHLPISHLQPFPASGSSNESPLRIRWSKCWSFSFSPYSEYSGVIAFLRLTGLILQSKGLSRVFSSTTVQKHQFSFLYGPTLTSIHDYQKNHSFARQTLVGKVTSLLLNMLSRLVIFSSKEQASFNFMAAVTICSDFGAQENKV